MRKLVVLAVVAFAVAACGSSSSSARGGASGEPSDDGSIAPARPPGSCHAKNSPFPQGTKPDRTCTPGAKNPAVTQATIGSTICRPGFTKTIRPPVSYTNALKREQIAEYGYDDTDVRHYEEDHLLPLELGGAPRDPKNLWAEPGGSPNHKDAIENQLARAVCDRQVSLKTAQHAILSDWTTAVNVIPAGQ